MEEFEEIEQGRKASSTAALYELYACELYPYSKEQSVQ